MINKATGSSYIILNNKQYQTFNNQSKELHAVVKNLIWKTFEGRQNPPNNFGNIRNIVCYHPFYPVQYTFDKLTIKKATKTYQLLCGAF